jgi:hypothetical protein
LGELVSLLATSSSPTAPTVQFRSSPGPPKSREKKPLGGAAAFSSAAFARALAPATENASIGSIGALGSDDRAPGGDGSIDSVVSVHPVQQMPFQ